MSLRPKKVGLCLQGWELTYCNYRSIGHCLTAFLQLCDFPFSPLSPLLLLYQSPSKAERASQRPWQEEGQWIKVNHRKSAASQSNETKKIPTKNVPDIKLPMLEVMLRGVGGSMAAKLTCNNVVDCHYHSDGVHCGKEEIKCVIWPIFISNQNIDSAKELYLAHKSMWLKRSIVLSFCLALFWCRGKKIKTVLDFFLLTNISLCRHDGLISCCIRN